MDDSSEAEDQFYDTREEITSVSDFGSDYSADCCVSTGVGSRVSESLGYEFWAKNPGSIHERRHRFLKWMGLSLDGNPVVEREELGDTLSNKINTGIDRFSDNGGAVLRNSDVEENHFLSSCSSGSCRSTEALDSTEDDGSEENRMCRIKNRIIGLLDGDGQNRILTQLKEAHFDLSSTVNGHKKTLGSSSLIQKEDEAGTMAAVPKKKVISGWLKKLNAMARRAERHGNIISKPDVKLDAGFRTHRVRVHLCRKRSKELSSLYAAQEFVAHNGSILTMEFSPDGQYLASAGEDGIVRVWKVSESERPNNFSNQETDPSCLYFSMNHSSKLATLNMDKEIGRIRSLGKSSESACVILPPKVFQILEKPLHEFRGHRGDVLALSWSKRGYLLSSSVDKTVRLWQVGQNQCLGVFSHNNYVTSVKFNPADDNYFISGSIDGKVRIWEVRRCRVVDWTDIREIVTAVCYSPDGKGGIVGSMEGSCRFYDIKDNYLQLATQICLQGKKKLPSKRITGFQFSPSDPSKVMITSADSQVRILSGKNVICKFKGMRNSGSHVSAYFTPDGKHIVGSSEDSNVHVWNYTSQDRTSTKSKSIVSSESFFSHNTSIAIPWGGMKSTTSAASPTTAAAALAGDDLVQSLLKNGMYDEDSQPKTHIYSSPDCLSLSRGFLLEALSRGSATWPEEKLLNSGPVSVSSSICKTAYKVLKSACQNTSSSHMWGLVIVTAGLDGRIRTFQNYGLPDHRG